MIDRATSVRAALRERQRGFLLNPFLNAPPALTGWNPADVGTGPGSWAFSAANRTAIGSFGSNSVGVRGFARSTGKFYFELTCAGTGGSTRIGMNKALIPLGGATSTINIWAGATSGPSVHIWKLSAATYLKNGTTDSTVTAGSIPNGTVTGWAVDFDAGTAIMLIGNVSKWAGYTFTPNSSIAPCAMAQASGDGATLLTTADELTYTPPAGFTAWG